MFDLGLTVAFLLKLKAAPFDMAFPMTVTVTTIGSL